MADKWMTMEEAGRVFGVSARTVREIFKADEVPVLRLQRKLRVRSSDVWDTLARHYKPLIDDWK